MGLEITADVEFGSEEIKSIRLLFAYHAARGRARMVGRLVIGARLLRCNARDESARAPRPGLCHPCRGHRVCANRTGRMAGRCRWPAIRDRPSGIASIGRGRTQGALHIDEARAVGGVVTDWHELAVERVSASDLARRAERWADLARIASICRHPRAEFYAQIARDVAALARGES